MGLCGGAVLYDIDHEPGSHRPPKLAFFKARWQCLSLAFPFLDGRRGQAVVRHSHLGTCGTSHVLLLFRDFCGHFQVIIQPRVAEEKGV